MKIINKLKIEISGIQSNVNDYTSDGYIINIFEHLNEATKEEDFEQIDYLLDKAIDWYKSNQSRIQSNEYVINKTQHLKNEEILQSLKVEISREQIEKSSKYKVENLEQQGESGMKKLFISHASEDKKYCDAFVYMLEELGVPEADILYSSSDRHGIPGDEKIFGYLRDHLLSKIDVFYILSDNYYSKPYCLNEMGAAWIVQNDFSIFTLPKFTCGIKGVIDSEKKAFNLSSPIDLINIKNKIEAKYGKHISEYKWEEVKSKVLDVIKS